MSYTMILLQGTPMSVGTLRYGLKISGEYGETVDWRHWYVCMKKDLMTLVYREKGVV